MKRLSMLTPDCFIQPFLSRRTAFYLWRWSWQTSSGGMPCATAARIRLIRLTSNSSSPPQARHIIAYGVCGSE